ncbi:hypothetical protein IVB45_22725 [Bradyrhizobium sp. 4]|nr:MULTISPECIES: hypothetical protein [unclassified Bradyrhizobium]MCK1402716.1 hypothetical protein [Bradyrhizobium sp. 39]MCK1748311.1 hypothetical protein [Bradyrhizobium sp. 135]UPJ32787.1 hypothetical protein IVB45_22725 [Bradyrhizobium sp. 4]
MTINPVLYEILVGNRETTVIFTTVVRKLNFDAADHSVGGQAENSIGV